MSAIVVGYMTVDAKQCDHTDPTHQHGDSHCIHDWRVRWGNVDRTAE